MLMRCAMAVAVFLCVTNVNAQSGQDSTKNERTEQSWSPIWVGDDAVTLQVKNKTPVKYGVETVSVKELHVPRQALKELARSDKAFKLGDVRGSADHLEKMLAIAPDLAVAHNGLGARYVALQEYEKGIGEFQKAVTLNPRYRLAADNLCATLCLQHRYVEAEPIARLALQIDPGAESSEYLLGSILIEEGKITEEAMGMLQKVKERYPRARMFLAKAMVQRGQAEAAAAELREYLKLPQVGGKTVAQRWLETLETQNIATKQGEAEELAGKKGIRRPPDEN
jgi:tetratricopeptide (TPR) repeat protein